MRTYLPEFQPFSSISASFFFIGQISHHQHKIMLDKEKRWYTVLYNKTVNNLHNRNIFLGQEIVYHTKHTFTCLPLGARPLRYFHIAIHCMAALVEEWLDEKTALPQKQLQFFNELVFKLISCKRLVHIGPETSQKKALSEKHACTIPVRKFKYLTLMLLIATSANTK